MTTRRGRHAAVRRPLPDLNGPEGNARLTGGTAAVLFVLLAAEGLTILQIHGLLTEHVFIGLLLMPPVLLKTGSTLWRFTRYYIGDPAFRRKGPPSLILRLLGPVVILLTFTVLATGVLLLVVGPALRSSLLFLHKASFMLWLGAMTVHVLGHLVDTMRLAPRDWLRHTRRDVAGAGLRQWAITASLVIGLLLAVVLVGRTAPWLGLAPHAGG